MQTTYKIAVVGLGAVGSTACIELLRQLQESGSNAAFCLHAFDMTRSVGRGLAYATQSRAHVLNMRATTMSLFADKPHDFLEWLRAEGLGGAEYVPRALFGRYVESRFQEAVRRAPPNIRIHIHFDEVIDCEERPDSVHVTTSCSTFAFDRVILAMGHTASAQSRATSHLPSSERLLVSPWSPRAYDTIASDARVGIVGSSLSAVDAALELSERGFRGEVLCASRHRVLPKVQSSHPPIQLRHLTRDAISSLSGRGRNTISLRDVLALMRLDFLSYPRGDILWQRMFEPAFDDALKCLREAIAFAKDGQVTWHTLLDATTEVISSLWNVLDESGKREFMELYESKWAMFRHSMPEPNAKKLLRLAEGGRLEATSGLRDIVAKTDAAGFDLVFADGARVHVDYVIDATGSSKQLNIEGSSLLQQMKNRGQLKAHPLGGVDVDFETSRLRFAAQATSKRISFVGIQTQGVHFYTNAFEMNRKRLKKAIAAMVPSTHGSASAGAVEQLPRISVSSLRLKVSHEHPALVPTRDSQV